MASILPDFEYDIFISYRHNDNRSGGVTEFVELLKAELAATIKEPLSIYFDKNPHDGLLETHSVDKSLEGKLKCLVFIPIISQTYCDPTSFAWQHEFVAFNKLAQADALGRDIKLHNGNIASRVLPIKVHDLDAADLALIETELGAMLRGIEFIYREPGVNRPLKISDKKEDNQNHTDYNNQLNKVANAIKEIIAAIKNPATPSSSPSIQNHSTQPPAKNKKYIVATFIFLLLVIAGFFVYPKIKSLTTPEENIDKSIAVLPFVDISQDKDQEYFSDGLSEELLNLLAKIPELKVIARTSSFSFKGKNEDLRVIAEKLGVAHILEGSVRKSGNTLRITAQLINAVDGTHLWSETYDRNMDDIFKVQDEIATAVVGQLRVKLLGKQHIARAINPEAYNLYLQGKFFTEKRNGESFKIAHEKFNQALAIDSSYALVLAELARLNMYDVNTGLIPAIEGYAKARQLVEKALRIDPQLPEAYAQQSRIYMHYDWDWEKAQVSMEKALDLGPRNTSALLNAGVLMGSLGHSAEAIAYDKRIIEIDPLYVSAYQNLSFHHRIAGNLAEAEAAVLAAHKLNPNFVSSYYNLALIKLAQGKAEEALEVIKKEPDESWRLDALPLIYYKLNRKAESDAALKEVIEKYENDSAYQIAEVYAYRGENDLAFQWLERAYIQRDGGLGEMLIDPLMKNLHNDNRWVPFLKKMKLVK